MTIKKNNRKKIGYINYITTKNIFTIDHKTPKNTNKLKTENKKYMKSKNRIIGVKTQTMNQMNIKINQLSSRSSRHKNKSITSTKLMLSSSLDRNKNKNYKKIKVIKKQ